MISQHTCRIIRRMIISLDNFLLGRITFKTLFNTLEGSLKAVEEKLSNSFYNEWDRYWVTFEIGLADNATNLDFYRDDVIGMKNLLLSICPMFEKDIDE